MVFTKLCINPGIQKWGAACGERGKLGNVIFQGMFPNIPENVFKQSGECRQTFLGMLLNIPGEYSQTFWRVKDWRLKNYRPQKDVNRIENANINKDCLGVKKLHLNRKSNSCSAKNLLKYLHNVWLDSDAVRHESVQNNKLYIWIINYYTDSRNNYPKKIRQFQRNAT